MPTELHSERRNKALVLTISNPATRNTLSRQVFAAGIEALDVAESDNSIRCIVLQGDGAHFCAGGEWSAAIGNDQAVLDREGEVLQRFHDFVEALRVYPKPVIAAVEGTAAGAGFSLALACDLIVAAEDASFAMSNARLGLTPDGGASWQLMQRVPRALAFELLCLSEPITAQRLHALGVVNLVADRGRALVNALEIAAALAQASSDALTSTKALVNQWPERSLAQALDSECVHWLELQAARSRIKT